MRPYYHNTGRKFDSNIFVRADYDIRNGISAYADLQYRHIHYTITGASDNFDWNTDAMARLDIHRDWNFFNPKLGVAYNNKSHRAYASGAPLTRSLQETTSPTATRALSGGGKNV